MAEDQDNVKSALQMLYELEGRDYMPAPEQKPAPTFDLKPFDENTARYGEAENVQPSTMSYPEQMRNVYETVKPTERGSKDAAAIAASSIYGAPMDIMGLLSGAREVVKGRIPSSEELNLPGGSHYLEERAKSTGKLSQDPSTAAQATGIIGSIIADPFAAAGKLGTLATVGIPAAAKGANVVEKALPIAQRELNPYGFYSHAAEVAQNLKQADRPEAILSKLTGTSGVRKDELIAAGILDEMGKPTQEFLAMERVNPQELAQRIRSSAPEFKETLLESPRYEEQIFFEPILHSKDPQEYGSYNIGRYSTAEEAESAARKYLEGRPELQLSSIHKSVLRNPIPVEHEVMFGPRTYPNASTSPEGASNYRELLLQLPERAQKFESQFNVTSNDRDIQSLFNWQTFATKEEAEAAIADRLASLKQKENDIQPEYRTWYDKIVKGLQEASIKENKIPLGMASNYVEGHYGEKYPNVIAHMRMQDVPDPDTGGKVLRIEEIQSDWAQRGRKTGFESTPAQIEKMKEKLAKLEEASEKVRLKSHSVMEQFGERSPEFKAAVDDYTEALKREKRERDIIKNVEEGRGLPSAPYVRGTDQWAELAIKRALKEAASNPEYEKMQLTAGDIQAKRWAGSKDAEGVAKFYDTTLKKELENWVKKLDPEAKVETRQTGNTRQQAEEAFEMDMSILENSKLEAEEALEKLNQKLEDPNLLYGEKGSIRAEKYKIEEEIYDYERQMETRREEFGGLTTNEYENRKAELEGRMQTSGEKYQELKTIIESNPPNAPGMADVRRRMLEYGEEYSWFNQKLSSLEQEFAEHSMQFDPESFYEVTITPKMREAIAKGLPRFDRGGKVVAEIPKISDNAIVHRALMLTGGRPANS